jgi:alkylation response protein AidB-like acyl-CoA dehydrogenase
MPGSEPQALRSPTAFLAHQLGELPEAPRLRAYEAWWEAEGAAISAQVDRAGTPWLRMYDAFGARVDEILYAPEYRTMLQRGYREGAVAAALEQRSLAMPYLLGYVTSFYDAGLYCPYTVSLATAIPLEKYGEAAVRERFLPCLLARDGATWQGATWMTEAKGGSDLGATVETVARRDGARWLLEGEKHFASNAGAELAVVAARPEGAPRDVRGLALFLVPRQREGGGLNYTIRRLKDKVATRSVPTGEVELHDSEAYLLGKPEWGVYLILEVLNLSRVANSVGSVGLAQRALADAMRFAEGRVVFGKPVAAHPLIQRQVADRRTALEGAFALAWEAVRLLDEVWRETPPYSERHQVFRLVAHLAKYWTAELAVQTAKWAMEVYAGAGTLAEIGVERWLREAMILAIWEGTPHRQMLDGLEVMQRKGAHRRLFHHLGASVDAARRADLEGRIDAHLALPPAAQESGIEDVFRDLASLTADALVRRAQSRG